MRFKIGWSRCGLNTGADAREFHRRAQKRLAHGLAVRRVVADAAVLVHEAHRAINLSAVHELGRQHLPVAQIFAVLIDLFVDRGELIALADIEHEVDVPGEDLGELESHGIGHLGRLGRLEQRGIDGGLCGTNSRLHRIARAPWPRSPNPRAPHRSVCVSLTLRDSSLSSRSVCVSLIASPGLRKSRLCRMPGKLRIAARSAGSSARRRKIPSSVSLRPTTTSIVAATLAS